MPCLVGESARLCVGLPAANNHFSSRGEQSTHCVQACRMAGRQAAGRQAGARLAGLAAELFGWARWLAGARTHTRGDQRGENGWGLTGLAHSASVRVSVSEPGSE